MNFHCFFSVTHRLKELLPQVEVVTEAPPPTLAVTTPTDTKRPRPPKNSDECSDDTIDDFASSEEKDTDAPFSTSLSLMKSFHLPSMLTNNSVCVKSEGVRGDSVPSSLGSATLGSLEQTPIDLSPQYYSQSHIDTSLSTANNNCGGSKEREGQNRRRKEREEDEGSKERENVASSCSNISSSSTPDNTIKYGSSSRESSQNSLLYANEWHLTLECSSDETDSGDIEIVNPNSKLSRTDSGDIDVVNHNSKRHKSSRNDCKTVAKRLRTDSDNADIGTPNPKRLKPSRTDSEDSDVVILDTNRFKESKTDHQSSQQCEGYINKHTLIDFIDLTQDSLSSTTTCHSITSSVDTSPSNDNSLRNENRQSRSLSPFCLPPTPGREAVDSILERSTFLFNPF